MAAYSGTNISKDGLVCLLDFSNFKCFKGTQTVNLAPDTDYSSRSFNTKYSAAGWGGDTADVYYYNSGGYRNAPYKKMIKLTGGTGGTHFTDHATFTLEEGKTYTISVKLKANRFVTGVNGHIYAINRTTDNAYRVPPTLTLTPQWVKHSWTYSCGAGQGGTYQFRNIFYVDTNLPIEVYWCELMVEEGSIASEYTKNSRSSSECIQDLTENNTVILNSLSVDESRPVFDGSSDYISLPDDIGYVDEVSTFAWFKHRGTPGGGYHIISGGSNLQISVHSSGFLRCGVNTTTGRHVHNAGSNINDGKWHHIGFTYSSSEKIMYLDGEAISADPVSGTLDNVFTNRTIGKYGSSDTYWLNGELGTYSVYNRKISKEEVKQNYEATKTKYIQQT